VIENKMDVVRKQLFARGLVAARFQGAFVHLQLVGSGKESSANGITADGIGNGAFLNHQIAQALLRGGPRR
jgi:hypothetical protein